MKAGRILLAGAAGTTAMTMLMLMAPVMGLPRMAIGEMLGGFLGIGAALGWAMHGMIGLTLAAIYATLASGLLPGRPAARGALFGALVFLMAQVAVMPMMGAGVFSGGNVPMIMGSLIGHLVFGSIVGVVASAPRPVRILA